MNKANNATKSTHESITDDSRGRSTVTRRLAMNMLVRSAAAIAVVPAIAQASPTVASQVDPIFAAIEAHKVAKASFLAAPSIGIPPLIASFPWKSVDRPSTLGKKRSLKQMIRAGSNLNAKCT